VRRMVAVKRAAILSLSEIEIARAPSGGADEPSTAVLLFLVGAVGRVARWLRRISLRNVIRQHNPSSVSYDSMTEKIRSIFLRLGTGW
jgi:hypothetical protein